MRAADDPATLGRRVELLYRNLRLGQIVSIVNASALSWVAVELVANQVIYLWWLAALAIAAFRIAQAQGYKAESEAERQANARAGADRPCGAPAHRASPGPAVPCS